MHGAGAKLARSGTRDGGGGITTSPDTTSEPGPAAPSWPGDRGGHVWPKDREVVAHDGTRIRYTVRGRDGGPWVVLCAGFLCPDNFWGYLCPPLFDDYRVAIVNYRGVGASTDPRTPGWRAHNVSADDYTIPQLAGDVGAVMAAEDIRDATLVGHSMGCQVALEVWNQQPSDRVAALVLVTGPYASPLHTFYGSKIGAYLFPFAYFGLPLLPRPLQRAIPKMLRLPTDVTMTGARALRALGDHTPAEGMRLYFEHFANVDPMVALKIAAGMHRYDASGLLEQIDVPTLVVVGGRDTFTPPAVGEVLYERIPDCELVELPGGTHGALLEYSDEIRDVLVDFLHRRLDHPGRAPTGDAGAYVRRHAR